MIGGLAVGRDEDQLGAAAAIVAGDVPSGRGGTDPVGGPAAVTVTVTVAVAVAIGPGGRSGHVEGDAGGGRRPAGGRPTVPRTAGPARCRPSAGRAGMPAASSGKGSAGRPPAGSAAGGAGWADRRRWSMLRANG